MAAVLCIFWPPLPSHERAAPFGPSSRYNPPRMPQPHAARGRLQRVKRPLLMTCTTHTHPPPPAAAAAAPPPLPPVDPHRLQARLCQQAARLLLV